MTSASKMTKSKKTTFRRFAAIAGFVCGAALSTGALAGTVLDCSNTAWDAWGVHGGTTTVTDCQHITFHAGPVDVDSLGNPLYTWSNGTQHGNKAFYGTDALNGKQVGYLENLSYSCVLGCVNGGPAGGPYTNIYVVDPNNAANRAILLVLPTGAGDFQDHITFNLDTYQVNESTNNGWLNNGDILGWNAVTDLIIANGTYAGMITPSPTFCTASAAGCDDGFTLAWGNRGATGPYNTDVTISFANGGAEGLTVPEPGTLALLGFGLAGLAMRRRKVAA